jgi:hypothetical protein
MAVTAVELSTLIQYAQLIYSVLITHVKCSQELFADTYIPLLDSSLRILLLCSAVRIVR